MIAYCLSHRMAGLHTTMLPIVTALLASLETLISFVRQARSPRGRLQMGLAMDLERRVVMA